jgi:restriction endonuclease S subunit
MSIESTVLKLSEVKKDNEKFRIDSEYFKKEYLEIENKLQKIGFEYNKNISIIKSGTTPKNRDENLKEGAVLLKTNDIRNNTLFYEKNSFFYIDFFTNEKMKSTKLKNNDVLINIVGATTDVIGRVSLVFDNFPSANITQAMAFCRIKENFIKASYLFTFLQTHLGKTQIKRLARPTGQYNLNLEEVGKIKIPIFSNSFQLEIEKLVKTAHQKLEESKEFYKQAENLLLKELDLIDYVPTTENISVKSFSESFKTSGRLDAEYYSPKYDEILEKIENYHGDFDKLGNLVKIKKSVETGTSFYEETGLEYIRVSNLSVFEISKSDIFINSDYFNPKEKEKLTKEEKIAKLQPKKDTILFSKDGSVGIAHKLNRDEKFITSGAILHLNIKNSDEVLPDFLTLVLNSILIKMQSERDAGGSIIKHWKPSEIENVLIPKITKSIQTEISNLIQKSFQLREESKQLLELAKKSVEVAIEKDEKEALSLFHNAK